MFSALSDNLKWCVVFSRLQIRNVSRRIRVRVICYVIVTPSIDWWLEYLLRPDVMICHGAVDIMTRETAGDWWSLVARPNWH